MTLDELKQLAEKHGCNEAMVVWFVYIELHSYGAENIFEDAKTADAFERLYRDLFRRFYPEDGRFDGDDNGNTLV